MIWYSYSETKIPRFLKGQNKGWVTAEYGMLPRSTHIAECNANQLKVSKVVVRCEIQLLIACSLRAVDLTVLGERSNTLDCDVIQVDGGTRTAAIMYFLCCFTDAVNELIKMVRYLKSLLKV